MGNEKNNVLNVLFLVPALVLGPIPLILLVVHGNILTRAGRWQGLQTDPGRSVAGLTKRTAAWSRGCKQLKGAVPVRPRSAKTMRSRVYLREFRLDASVRCS